jgi:rSAM/selenodomain-associated transferase 2
MRLSVIIPVLNEAGELPGLLEHLAPLCVIGAEVIVADGGSEDGSQQLVSGAGVRLVCAGRGRARQMNAGATAASGDVLLFLHADTRLPPSAEQAIEAATRRSGCRPENVWGRFDVRIHGSHFMLRVIAALMNWRSRLTGIATGDQAMFVARPAFDAAGGFPELPLMEDIELSKRLLALSRPVCLLERVTTSGRRWETRGVWKTIWLMWRLRWSYWRGVPASELAKIYR